jgi:acetate kinase
MTAGLLTLNAGQSSVKAALFAVSAGRAERLAGATIADLGTATPVFSCDPAPAPGAGPSTALSHASAARVMLDWAAGVAPGLAIHAVGHRITHGGLELGGPVRATPETLAIAARYVPLVPLHQPHNLALVEAVARARPDLPQVLCFDTAFHRTIPDVGRRFALPRELIDAGVVRYGFHGLSYESIVAALPAVSGGRLPGRLVVAHLGAGASLCAIREGRSVACTLGMTGMDGLPMGTRVGSIDPGALLYLLEQRGMAVADLADLLWRRSGLLGLSGGISSRMQDLLASPDPRAREAVDFFVYRVVREIGSLAAALGGLDALVFTGGCGERSDVVRASVCAGVAWLGLRVDEPANAAGGPRITTGSSAVTGWVIPSDEEATIARQALATCPEAFGLPGVETPSRVAVGAGAGPGGPPIARNVP